MTYRIFDIKVSLLIAPETKLDEFFSEDEPGITQRLAIVSEIEAEAKMEIQHYQIPQEGSEAAASLSKVKGAIAIFDSSSQNSFSEIFKFLMREAQHLQGVHTILIGVSTKGDAIDFKMDELASYMTHTNVTTRKELDRVMRGFGSRLIHILRSEEDA